MEKTPKSLRLQIGLFGRTNVGKSSFLNYISGQDVAITSPVPGTTTDVVEKTMELLPVGPVVFLDTAGLDDASELSAARMKKTAAVFDRADIVVLVTGPDQWTAFEETVCAEAEKRRAGCLIVINKTDIARPGGTFLETCRKRTGHVMACSCLDAAASEKSVDEFKKHIAGLVPDGAGAGQSLIGDLVKPGGIAVLVVPIDLQAPRGRLILPQVSAIRDALDNDASVVVVKEREYAHLLTQLSVRPDIVVCDSQVVLKMVADTPKDVQCTTFSILFSRARGDLRQQAAGLGVIDSLRNGDRVLIAEACTHHALEDDIGRVKIPRWLRQYTGCDLAIDVYSGRDYPQNLAEYKLVVHCGSCMLTRRETMARIGRAAEAGVAITNYGLCISFVQGVAERVLEPFPAALDALQTARARKAHKGKTV
jgi:[FeFe] hydrogenase H-cluster maturation GTPase HydF